MEGSGPSCAPRRHGDLGPGGRPLGDSLARFPALGPSCWGLAWSVADTVLSEQGQRVVDAGLESIAVTWDLAMPARRRQPAQESFARHCRCDRRLDRGRMVLLVVERLFIPDGFDLSRRSTSSICLAKSGSWVRNVALAYGAFVAQARGMQQ